MRRFAFLLSWVVVSTVALAQVGVELSAEPHYSLVGEGTPARVWMVAIPRLASTELHQHRHDYLTVALAEGRIASTRLHDATISRTVNPGEAYLVSGGFQHVMRNELSTPYRVIEIELMKASSDYDTAYRTGTAPYTSFDLPVDPSRSYTTRLQRDIFNALSVQLLPGDKTAIHVGNSDVLLVAISALNLGEEHGAIRLEAGEVLWLRNGAGQSLKNIGKDPARFITVEFK